MRFERKTDKLEYGIPGFTSQQVLAFLNDIMTWARPENCLEIGSYMGKILRLLTHRLLIAAKVR